MNLYGMNGASQVGRLFIDVIYSNDDRHLLLPVDALDVSIYESTYLAGVGFYTQQARLARPVTPAG